ncbi:MAG: siroheme synthase [Alphaproteobacteria bacterium]|nr:siroheme synthase [Alphaproteobacteria bacterium]
MLPIVLDPTEIRAGLAGAGEGLARREATLRASGVLPEAVPVDAAANDLEGLKVLFVAGLDAAASTRLAKIARAAGVLVNVEDMPALCDFHVPASVRRGDLLVTVSTGGKAPGFSKLFREWIERQLGEHWELQIETIADERRKWRRSGLSLSQVSERTRAYVREHGLLP